MNNPSSTYLNALTFPRFVLALIVVIVHFGLHLPFAQNTFLSGVFHHGAIAVSFFFFLSGFVLAYNYTQIKSARSFYWKRLIRLYPLYLITFFFVLLSVYFLQGNIPEMIYAIANGLGLQSWIPGYALQVNFPSWSLSVEFFFYATFPLISWVFHRIKWRLFSICILIAWTIGLIQHIYFVEVMYDPNRYYLEQFILYFPLFHFTTFLTGFYGGKLVHKLRGFSYPSYFYTFLAITGILLFIGILSTENLIRLYGHNGSLAPIFLMICIGLSLDKKWFAKIIGSKPFIFLGDISYSMYMWQFPVFLWFTHVLGIEKIEQGQFFVFLICLIIISALSFIYLEKPIRKRSSKNKSVD